MPTAAPVFVSNCQFSTNFDGIWNLYGVTTTPVITLDNVLFDNNNGDIEDGSGNGITIIAEDGTTYPNIVWDGVVGTLDYY